MAFEEGRKGKFVALNPPEPPACVPHHGGRTHRRAEDPTDVAPSIYEEISPLPQDVVEERDPHKWMEEIVFKDVGRNVASVWTFRQKRIRRESSEPHSEGTVTTEDILRYAPPEWAKQVRASRDAWKDATQDAPLSVNETSRDQLRIPGSTKNLLHGIAHLSRDNETHYPALTVQDRMVEAYDCTVPSEVRPVKVKTPSQCQRIQPVEVSHVEMSILLLQKAHLQRVRVRECSDIRSELSFFCGNYDHMTYLPSRSRLGYARTISAGECNQYWRDRQITVHEPGLNRWRKYDLEIQATNSYMYQSVGSVTATDSGYYWDAQCVGGSHEAGPGSPVATARISSVNAAIYGELTLQEHKAVVSPQGTITLSLAEVELAGRTENGQPCRYDHGHCQVGSKTYVWEVEELGDRSRDCAEYQRTRKDPVAGRLITTDDDQLGVTRTFISNDGSMIRLIQKEPLDLCGSPGWATNYDLLYFVEWSRDTATRFSQNIHPSELSIATYSNLKDDFLYGAVTNYLKLELSRVLQKACEDELADRQMAYGRLAAEQAAAVASSTAYLGRGRYVTAAGEAWYQYTCRPILATALDRPDCYEALPVQLAPKDLYVYLRTRGLVDPMNSYEIEELGQAKHPLRSTLPDFFVSPITRMVGTRAAARPCSPLFQPLYTNVRNQWIRATPSIEVTTAPQELFANTTSHQISPAPRYDMEGGGVYDVDKIRAHEMWMMNPSRGLSLINHLARKDAEGTLDRRHLGSRDPLTDLWPSMPWFPYSDTLWTIWEVAEAWSRVCMLALGAYVFIRILRFAMSRCIRIAFGFSRPGQTRWRRAGLPRKARRVRAGARDWWYRQAREGYSPAPGDPEDHDPVPPGLMTYGQWRKIIRGMAKDHRAWTTFNRRTKEAVVQEERHLGQDIQDAEERRLYPDPRGMDQPIIRRSASREPRPSTASAPPPPAYPKVVFWGDQDAAEMGIPRYANADHPQPVALEDPRSREPHYEVLAKPVTATVVTRQSTAPHLTQAEILQAQGFAPSAGFPRGGAYLSMGEARVLTNSMEGWGAPMGVVIPPVAPLAEVPSEGDASTVTPGDQRSPPSPAPLDLTSTPKTDE